MSKVSQAIEGVAKSVETQKAANMKANTAMTMTVEAFVLKAIKVLRKDGYKGIHTVYSGFNDAFRRQFPDKDVVAVTKGLADSGKIALRFVSGGAMLYFPNEAPVAKDKGSEALKAILS